MAQKLKSRPVSSPPTSTGTDSALTLSPTGRFVELFDSSGVTATWRWNGTTYVNLGTGLADGLQSGEFTEDETYIVGLTSGTGQRLQLRSVDVTTGATTILHGLPSSSLPLEMDAAIIRVTGDYFVAYNRNKAAGSVFLVKIDRGTNTLVLKNVITLNDIRFALQSYGFKIPGKPAFLFSQRQDGSSAINIVRVNTTNETLEAPANVVTGSWADGAFTSIAISDDGNFWYGQHPTNPALNRYGSVNADTNTIVVNGAVPSAKDGVYSAFIFGSTAIFTPKVTAGSPYDQYQLFAPSTGVISADPGGTFAAMDAPTGPFSNLETRRNYDSTISAPRKFAFVTNRSLAVNPGFYVYEEGLAPTDAELISEAPMGDAWFTSSFETGELIAVAPLANTWMVSDINGTGALVAEAPMGDAFTRFSAERVQLVAEAPMGDAFTGLSANASTILFAEAPMGDAFAPVLVENESTFYGAAPFADVWFVSSDQEIDAIATAPIGDAWAGFDNVVNFSFIAEAPMGEATASTTNAFMNITAEAPMGDAGIAVSVTPGACRRRSMMVL